MYPYHKIVVINYNFDFFWKIVKIIVTNYDFKFKLKTIVDDCDFKNKFKIIITNYDFMLKKIKILVTNYSCDIKEHIKKTFSRHTDTHIAEMY